MRLHQWNIVSYFVTALAISTVTAFSSNATADVYEEYKVSVFNAGDDGYDTYRIPTIVQGTDDRLYAFVEGRKNSKSDSGDIDLVMKHSDDGGRTWSRMVLIKDAGEKTAGNPSPVVDSRTGRVCLLYCINNNAVYSTYSDDKGNTWSEHKQVSKDVLGPDIKRIYTGPVHGIQLTRGENTGRLVVASCYRSSLSWDCIYGACVFYSDDGGEHWLIGATAPHQGKNDVHPSENVAVELIDGTILFNARNHFYNEELLNNPTRVVAYSSNGGESYDEPFTGLITTVIQNSMVRFKAVTDARGRTSSPTLLRDVQWSVGLGGSI